ncbi:MAG: hypothetical protein SGJ09_11415 [Phycisphaerae bacterium]|nr:hypothetical protein [Phycisphaerae bacterium]
MRWGVFIVMLLVGIVLDTSFMQVFAVGTVWPAIVPALVTFVALHATRPTALWAAFLAGLLVDCTSPSIAFLDGVRPYQLIGPTALGFVLGAQLVLPLRSMVVRRNPLALGVLTILFVLATMVVTTAIYSARGWYAGTLPPWMPTGTAVRYMGTEALGAMSSGAIAVLIAIPLNRTLVILGLAGSAPWSPRRG